MHDLHRSIAITDRSSAGEVRRVAMSTAGLLGFEEQQRSDIGIVATEAAKNILLHAQKGEVLIGCQQDLSGCDFELIALDGGPGIRDVSRALEDGYSTAGTPGEGLGAMNRLSDTFAIYSAPDRGTALFSRFRLHRSRQDSAFAAIRVPMHGETRCGDAHAALPGRSRSIYMVADGLGHGPGASEAAEAAVAVLRAHPDSPPAEILEIAHHALKKTRGAAVSIAAVDHERGQVTYAGVGNVAASLAGGGTSRSMVSQNGTVGMALPRVQEYNYPFEPGTLLLMFSDGLTSRCSLSGYPGIRGRPLPLIAGLLYRDFSRRRDDATVLVANLTGAPD
jgi:anti-sigma regulatory factor (Ser/Thr protein kinase)